MSATPRTDEVTLGEFEYGRDYDGNYQVAALDYEVLRDRARELERENNELRVILARGWRHLVDQYDGDRHGQ